MTASDDTTAFDPEAVRDKYAEERAKRMTEDRGILYDLRADERFQEYTKDPFTPFREREPLVEDVDVAVIGGGMSGVTVGAKLRDQGVRKVVLIDKAGGIGGTWYWNRYPGVMCDVESYIYMPMLEEMNYVPTTRYASGDEIRRHLDAIATKYGLVDDALFHTGVDTSRWDDATSRWIIATDRGDEVRARYLIHATGILNLMKLPAIPGMDEFEGKAFHTARWDYEYTGGGPDDPHLTKLADKVVGVVGVGATGIQAVPPLAESAKHVYVFQRTPSAIGERGNRPTDPDFVDTLRPGWQKERMENFSAVMIGRPVDRDLVDDGWTLHTAQLNNPRIPEGMTATDIAAMVETFDYDIMETHRSRIDEIVADPDTAAKLKPYYRYGCKRPCFHDEYLAAFNNPNVTLVDCPGGVTRITPHGAIAGGEEYELDCIVFATGFEGELTPFPRRAGHDIIGRDGITMEEKWKEGVLSLHGMTTHGFPNMFIMPAPGQQAVTTHNFTHLMVVGADHVAGTIAALAARGVKAFETTEEAEQAWTDIILSTWRDNSAFMAACTPSRLNFEGNPTMLNPRSGAYGGGYGDFFGYRDLLVEWRERGDFEGFALETASEALDAVVSVAVVTGGAVGIGAAIAEELGRQGLFVVTVDPGVAVDGSPGEGGAEATTAQRIVEAGGTARASNISVTDEDAVRGLFDDLVAEFGALDTVVNVAGISRPTGFAHGTEDDWRAVLSVHLDGYLNVLRAALPHMSAAGHGRILGVTSGSGWRAADAGAYSCAKRAVAALTWRVGQETPPGVTVNALSPIAATRMVLGALSRQAGGGNTSGRDAATGGVSLGLAAVPPPEHLGPVGAYLAGESFASWSRGQIMFSNGAELAWVVPPRLLEVARTSDVGSLLTALEALGAKVFAPAEAAQASNGGGNPRLGTAFEDGARDGRASAASRVAVVSDMPERAIKLTGALASRGIAFVPIAEPATTFAGASEQLATAAATGPFDAVVVTLAGGASSSSDEAWARVLDEHAGVTEQIGTDAAWVRAVSDYSTAANRPVRVVTVVDASTAGGRSRAQSAAQLSRVAHAATENRVDAFALSVEASGAPVGEIVTHLVADADAGALSGAELAVGPDWFGLRSHPHPAGSVSFGGPAVPEWVDDALRQMVGAEGES